MRPITKPAIRLSGKNTSPSNLRQQRLVTVVTPKEKKQAEKLAALLFDGNIGNLVRSLLRERAALILAEKKALKAKLATKATPLTGRKHVATAKPGRKSSTRNSATRSAKSSAAKNGVATKSRSKSSGTSTKGRRSTNRSS